MKVFVLLICSFLLIADCIAQDSFLPEKSADKGILLDKGWKFQAGDNPEWADPNYDDKEWQSINPTLDIHNLPQIPKTGIGWFRLHLFPDSNTLKNQLALVIQQSGASEIYLNGILFHHFGVLSADPDKVRAYDPSNKPILFPLTKGVRQLMAIRYALQPHASYTTIFATKNPAFSIVVKNLVAAIDNDKKFSFALLSMLIFIIGVCVMLIILHLAFYLFYLTQKANLYFSLFGFFFMASCISRILLFFYAHTVLFKFYLANISMDLILISYFFLLSAIYYLFEQKKDKVYWSLMVLAIIAFFINPLVYGWGWFIGGALMQLLIVLNINRIAFLSFRKNKRGSWIIVAGSIFCLVIFIAFLMVGNPSIQSFDERSLIIRYVIYILSVLSIPAATSIYLGLDFAFTSRSLKQRLEEVEYLSAKTISQEQEKQQILASQNINLEKQVTERTSALSQSLKELKETQGQLIQSEKMASLGELTAGIAHEIQNPLNFVNNFSEVNKELIDEAELAIDKGKINEAKELLTSLRNNQSKINQHGKRADAIVKGMLQHSRETKGQKEPADINALAAEYLRLSHQGLRAKDKAFDVALQSKFDPTIGIINIIPQEIGRVLLNLYNNAFYAVSERKKNQPDGYEPTVSVSTLRVDGIVEIRVRDNGAGIPQKVRDKIFQPFFTTKPAGQGTGLGLSLSYDIVKAHGGEIKVETKEGEFAEFVIQLPISVSV